MLYRVTGIVMPKGTEYFLWLDQPKLDNEYLTEAIRVPRKNVGNPPSGSVLTCTAKRIITTKGLLSLSGVRNARILD